MPREIEEIPLVAFKLDYGSEIPLYRQLYDLLQKAIIEGKLKEGARLPGTRSLASDLKVSRNTVTLAFNQLSIEGYIRGKTGSGMYVNQIPENLLRILPKSKPIKIGRRSAGTFASEKLEKHFKEAHSFLKKTDAYEIIPFENGIPAVNEFPIKTWLRIIKNISAAISASDLSYGDSAGYYPLREEIASYLRSYRAVNCSADRIVIISGSQQGLDLIGRLLLKKEGKVWLEDPGYYGAKASMFFTDASVYPSPIDNEGLDITYSAKKNPMPDLIYTTPSHQFPLGVTMSISRRLQLIEFAKKNKCWIIEDDYDSEFRYSGNPLPSLQGLDKNGRVLYLGTFSKVLFPGLRLGYLVLPDADLAKEFYSAKFILDRQCPIFEQLVLTKFIKEGYFTRHIRKMKMLYKSRQEFLLDEINKNMDGLLTVNPSPAGMHIIGWLNEKMDDKQIAIDALKNKIIVNPLSNYSMKYFKKPGLILGYTAYDNREIKKAVSELKKILHNQKVKR